MPEITSTELAVKAVGIEKSFGDGNSRIHVLKRIDLSVNRGELAMLVGPSGCGKTTLLSIVGGTLRADAGEVHVFGQSLHRMFSGALARYRSRQIGFIFQQFNLIPTISCAENVALPLLIAGMAMGTAVRMARDAMSLVGISDQAGVKPALLSGGQQQRVAIARALVHEPGLVICDEPTASLDARNGTIVMDLLSQFARSKDRAVLIVTHDSRIFRYADRIMRMDDGSVVPVCRDGSNRYSNVPPN